MISGILTSFLAYAKDIKLSHSLFALPFATSAFFLIDIPVPTMKQCLLLLICMVSARSFAMGMNRFLDRNIDKENPRTCGRAIPNGDLDLRSSIFWNALAAIIFVFASFSLNRLTGILSLPLLFVLACYSLMKHLTLFTHWYLGMCLGFAPTAVALAMTGSISLPLILLGIAIACWTGGFDIIYSLQDREFDKLRYLRSIPAKFGLKTSLLISKISFSLMVLFLCITGWQANMKVIYFSGVVLIAAILAYEHVLIRNFTEQGQNPNLGKAFFTANAYVSFLFLSICVLDTSLSVSFPLSMNIR